MTKPEPSVVRGVVFSADIIAVNGAEVVVVEVKTTLKVRRVDRFVGLMQEFTDLMPRYRGSTVYAGNRARLV